MNGPVDDTKKGAVAIAKIIMVGTEAKEYVNRLDLPRTQIRPLTDTEESGLRDKLREWLDKVRELAIDFSPESYSITLSVPFVGSVSFTWPITK